MSVKEIIAVCHQQLVLQLDILTKHTAMKASLSAREIFTLRAKLSGAAAQCIVIGPVCLQRAGGRAGGRFVVVVWVCYHDNSKFHASIFTKLGL